MGADRYVCVHAHFYQPPRENPWLEAVELQDAAYPFHDWNERITAECYATNAASRILGGDRRIEGIVNNYARISFDVGPTLLSWMKTGSPGTYAAILAADRDSSRRFSGHGSAIAQAYSHMILPLANARDRRTQIVWGLRDFQARFGRDAEGMWLAETAADLESLDLLAGHGIRFTILAPTQARRVRPIGSRHWKDVSGGRIDPTMPYLQHLPSGRSIALFFYDGPISGAVAFEGLLKSGEQLAGRILGSASGARDWPQLLHIATDGETYGHHHRHGEMALTYALHHIEANGLARLTNYAEHLERCPPTHEADIFEHSSWSCVHGVDRWRSDCGCSSGGHPGWNQAWRAPLRNALDWLRDDLGPRYEEKCGRLLRDPWAARDDYIAVVLDRSPENAERFWKRHATHPLEPGERVTALKLLELQRHAMLMYTSCGWFFDDLSGIETVQVIRYAARAVQLARDVLDVDPEPGFVERLAQAKSNVPESGDGARIYDLKVRPAMVDLAKVGAHYAVSSLFNAYADEARIFSYAVQREDLHRVEAGKQRLLVGRARVRSLVTGESVLLSFGAQQVGDHNVQGAVREYRGAEPHQALVREADAAFGRGDFAEVVRLLDRHFDGATYSLKSLFRDQQRAIVSRILESTLGDAETTLRQVYQNYAGLMRFLADLGTPAPRVLHSAAEFVLNADLRSTLEEDDIDIGRLRTLLDSVRREKIVLDAAGLGLAAARALERLMKRIAAAPDDPAGLKRVNEVARFLKELPFEVDVWEAQNVYYQILQRVYPEMRARTEGSAREWIEVFCSLGESLAVRVS